MSCNSIYGIPFSQFIVGGEPVTGDILVGLRGGLDTQFTFNGAAGTGTAIVNTITQTGHGFVFGNVVYFNGTQFVLAKADTAVDAEVIGIVSAVVNANTFDLLSNGFITGLSALVPGAVYFLSDVTAGLLTTTEPSTIGHISKPLLIATSNVAGFFFNWRGKVVPNSSSWNIVTTNTTMLNNANYAVYTNPVNLTLPAIADFGDEIWITNVSGSFTIVQGAGQQVTVGTQASTLGAGGSVASTAHGDSILLLCTNTNVSFQAISTMGNLTIV